MSMDLDFWKYKNNVEQNHKEVYEQACCGGVELPVLESLPIEEIRGKISNVFKDWTAMDGDTYEKEGHGSFSIFTTSQIVRFDCYDMGGDEMNTFIDIMAEYGCALYDPQTGERFEW